MSNPSVGKGITFQVSDSVTNIKLHKLVDEATWSVTNQAIGDIIYYSGVANGWVRLPAGAEGQVLTMGASGLPEWA